MNKSFDLLDGAQFLFGSPGSDKHGWAELEIDARGALVRLWNSSLEVRFPLHLTLPCCYCSRGCRSVLHCTAYCCIVLYCIVLCCIVLSCVVWCSMVSSCVVWFRIVLYCAVLCCVVWRCFPSGLRQHQGHAEQPSEHRTLHPRHHPPVEHQHSGVAQPTGVQSCQPIRSKRQRAWQGASWPGASF